MMTPRAQLAETVAALREPSAFPDETRRVETVETHMSFVFLTSRHAYKLKKPIRTPMLDYTTADSRRLACQTELELNRRLAPDVYLAVAPVVRTEPGLRVERTGPAVDWLVKMRRLPRDRMLDSRIERQAVRVTDVERIAAVLTSFYAGADRVPTDGATYRSRIVSDIESKKDSLSQPRYGLSDDAVRAAVRAQKRWIEQHTELLGARSARLVDAHGDLRPEHICLEEPMPVVIDCLEFDRTLRLLDPVSELSFLGLECRRLGASWIGDRLLSEYADMSGDRPAAPLIAFYQSYHALVRAAVAVWHVDDEVLDHSDRWRARGSWYLQTIRQLL